MRRPRQLVYSLRELGTMTGLSKFRVGQVLRSNGVKLNETGRQGKRVVFVSELERALPELVDSVRFKPEDD